jgi:hypothetical protein
MFCSDLAALENLAHHSAAFGLLLGQGCRAGNDENLPTLLIEQQMQQCAIVEPVCMACAVCFRSAESVCLICVQAAKNMQAFPLLTGPSAVLQFCLCVEAMQLPRWQGTHVYTESSSSQCIHVHVQVNHRCSL